MEAAISSVRTESNFRPGERPYHVGESNIRVNAIDIAVIVVVVVRVGLTLLKLHLLLHLSISLTQTETLT